MMADIITEDPDQTPLGESPRISCLRRRILPNQEHEIFHKAKYFVGH